MCTGQEVRLAGADAEMKVRVKSLLDAYARAENLLDEELLAKRAELEALGERAYPALCELLRETDDPVYQARLINVFVRSDGDKVKPVEAVRQYLNAQRNAKAIRVPRSALHLLSEHGTKEDLPLLAHFAVTGDLVAKTDAQRAIARIEARTAQQRIPPTPQKSNETSKATNSPAK